MKSLPLEPADIARHHAVVVCGDILPHREILRDSASRAAGLALFRCSEDWEQAVACCKQSNVAVIVARQAFIEQLPSTDLMQLANYGTGRCVLAILECDIVETTTAAKMIRLGCRGVLPSPFMPKLLRRAVLAMLGGELWAPRVVISELLSDLLRSASLKAENGLTPREMRILDLTLQGFKNSAIADALFISLETVRWHKRRLNRKLHGPPSPRPQAQAIPPTLPPLKLAN